MHFDDRLATVLRQPVSGEAIARIQFRQLVDLLGTHPSAENNPRIDAAYARLAELSYLIPSADRLAILDEPPLRLRNPRLVAQLAAGQPNVSAAAIAAARLNPEEWYDLIPALPLGARGFVGRRGDIGERARELLERLGVAPPGLPPANDHILDLGEFEEAPSDETPDDAVLAEAFMEGVLENREPPESSDGIRAIVQRIEEFRKTRRYAEDYSASPEAPHLPLDGTSAPRPGHVDTFDFTTDTDGRIVWANQAVAPMAVGLRIPARETNGAVRVRPELLAAFRNRQPIRDMIIDILGAPAISGEWQIDAAPRFDQAGGRFIGYCGRMRRPAAPDQATALRPADNAQADRMRQILHELRTPVNAIQGFAEVIQQQLFGPTPHEYRALAATIAGDSARMLAAFEELDRLVKLESSALELEPGECDLAALAERTASQLEAFTAPRRSGFAIESPDGPLIVPIDQSEGERLVWRLLATLAGAAAPGEILDLRMTLRGDMAELTIDLPAGLAGEEGEGPFGLSCAATQPQALSAGMFGTGFTLRLAETEARAAGGKLTRIDNCLVLSLPVQLDRGGQGF